MTQPGLIIVGDVLDGLARLDADSVDAIVTDPPYDLLQASRKGSGRSNNPDSPAGRHGAKTGGFMGLAWDATGVAFRQETWEACLRVLKPGGHLIAFGGGRTHHRMWCAIEDAGFEVRELVCWLFGTGFPKSLDVSKAIDRAAPRVGMFDAFARHFAERRAALGRTQNDIAQHFLSKTGGVTGCVWNWENGANVPTVAQWHVLRSLLDLSDEWLPLIERVEAEREITGHNERPAGWFTTGDGHDITAPATDSAKQWEGYGTALKPAVEPILLARKPLSEPTVAANVLKWGTGALAIDATRVGTEKLAAHGGGVNVDGRKYGDGRGIPAIEKGSNPHVGRWPANVIFECTCDDPQPLPEKARKRKNAPTQSTLLGDAEPAPKSEAPQGVVHQPDCPAGMLDAQSGELTSGTKSPHHKRNVPRLGHGGAYGDDAGTQAPREWKGDSGGASRFFYCAKASRAERERGLADFEPITGAEAVNRKADTAGLKSPRAGAGRSAKQVRNTHSTVKPVALMRWLVRLVTPPGGRVVDPFCGSGSTLIAAREEGHDFVGIDLSAEYCRIAQARVGGAELVQAEAPEDAEPEWEE